jgi:hypothetical protein
MRQLLYRLQGYWWCTSLHTASKWEFWSWSSYPIIFMPLTLLVLAQRQSCCLVTWGHGFKSWKWHLAEIQGKATYIRPKVVGSFPGPCASESYVHRAALTIVCRTKVGDKFMLWTIPGLLELMFHFLKIHDLHFGNGHVHTVTWYVIIFMLVMLESHYVEPNFFPWAWWSCCSQ